MKNVLILADGSVAKHFIDWINKKRVAENRYFVTCFDPDSLPEKTGQHIHVLKLDPTSYSKLNAVMSDVKPNIVFIVMESMSDAEYTIKNVHLINPKMRVVLLNQWGDKKIAYSHEGIIQIDMDTIAVSHLYDHLPNVPVLAQNVGKGEGEIMEVHVPFGSAYAYRHVGSIVQRKWKIVAIYRNRKQIIPTTATMIRPDDTLLTIGKPIVLSGVYNTVNKRVGLFPEPFGENIYLLLDCNLDAEASRRYVEESIYLAKKLGEKHLYIRLLSPGNFEIIKSLRKYESDNVHLLVTYEEEDKFLALIEYDVHRFDVGIVMSSIEEFKGRGIQSLLYSLKKVVYLFGDYQLYDIHKSIVLMDGQEKLESISATAFDVTESLDLELELCDFDPEGEFDNKKAIIEHYETLTQVFSIAIQIEQKIANPIREMEKMGAILQIAPFEKQLNGFGWLKVVSTKVSDFLLTTKKHPKLLVPYALNDE